VVRSRRVRWIVATCAVAVVAVVFLTEAHAWAEEKGDQGCRRVTVHSAQNRPMAAPSGPSGSHSWRGVALRAAGCNAWRQMRQRVHHRR
jgi:hypothetical protein